MLHFYSALQDTQSDSHDEKAPVPLIILLTLKLQEESNICFLLLSRKLCSLSMNPHHEADFKVFFLLSQHVPKYLLCTSNLSQLFAPRHSNVSSVSGGESPATHDSGSFFAPQLSLLLWAADTRTTARRKRKSWKENDVRLLDQMLLPQVTKRRQSCANSYP